MCDPLTASLRDEKREESVGIGAVEQYSREEECSLWNSVLQLLSHVVLKAKTQNLLNLSSTKFLSVATMTHKS